MQCSFLMFMKFFPFAPIAEPSLNPLEALDKSLTDASDDRLPPFQASLSFTCPEFWAVPPFPTH